MSKSKSNTKTSGAGGFAIAAKTLEKFDKEITAIAGRVGKLEELDVRFARLENSLKPGPERPFQLISEEELQDIHNKIQAVARKLEEVAVAIAAPAADTAIGADVAAMNAATREALRKEIAAVVEQRLAAGFLEATSAQITNIRGELRELARDIARDAIAEDKRTSSRRGHRSAVTPA